MEEPAELQKSPTYDIYFLTYGNKAFKKSRERIIKEAKATSIFTKYILETEDIINDSEFNAAITINPDFMKVFKTSRGGGYWIWKPYILWKTLNKMNTGDILVYADAGCTIPNCEYTTNKFKEYFQIINATNTTNTGNNTGIFGIKNPNLEYIWTKAEAFNYFDVYNNADITHTTQFAANHCIIKKCALSCEIINKLWNIAQTEPNLYSEYRNTKLKLNNYPGFKAHRHDQSVMSILFKLYNVPFEPLLKNSPIKVSRIRG